MNFVLCVALFLTLACVVIPLVTLAILAMLGRKTKAGRDTGAELSLPPTNGVR